MLTTTDKEYEQIGQTRGLDDHDLIHDLSRRLDCLWRYDQYIANRDGHPDFRDGHLDLQKFWNGAWSHELQSIHELNK